MLLKIYVQREKRELSPLWVIFLMPLYHIHKALELLPSCWSSSQLYCTWTSPACHMPQGIKHLNREMNVPISSPFYSRRKKILLWELGLLPCTIWFFLSPSNDWWLGKGIIHCRPRIQRQNECFQDTVWRTSRTLLAKDRTDRKKNPQRQWDIFNTAIQRPLSSSLKQSPIQSLQSSHSSTKVSTHLSVF